MNITHARHLCAHGYELFPIAPGSKKPLRAGWLDAPALTPEEASRHERCGVRLREGQLVVDIDPRHGGELGKWAYAHPVVETPGGGWHVYCSMPGMKVRHLHPDFPGHEFKTRGRYVVAPGSDDYDWAAWACSLPAPAVPDSILDAITIRAELAAGEGEWSPGELAAALEGLSAEDFREHDAWFQLMCACHEATAGHGLEEFVAWSTSDPEYSSHGGQIRGRWKSFRAGREGNAGIGTLVKILSDHGAERPQSVRARNAQADFDGEDPAADFDTGNERVDLPESNVGRLNKWFKVVDDHGSLRVYRHVRDEALARRVWVKYKKQDFLDVCKSQLMLPMVQHGETRGGDPKYVPMGEYWLLEYRKKPTYTGVTFMPECADERTPDGRLNMWKGFAVQARKGSWAWLKELCFEALCGSDGESYEYVLNWLARAVQRPWEPGGTALVFRGPKGTGKGTLGRAFVRLFGQHGMHIASKELLTGRFNLHLRDVVALFADEAFWAGDKAGEGVLKALITEPALAYEGKGRDVEMGRNCVHLIMASNEQWVVPAGLDGERRFAVFEVLEAGWARRHWDMLNAELEAGGLEAMLAELLARDVSSFDHFRVPRTQALAEQKIRTMDPMTAWLYELAKAGWKGLENPCQTADLYASFVNYCDFREIRGARMSDTAFGIALRRLVRKLRKVRLTVDSGERPWAYELPDAEEVAREIEEKMGMLDTPDI